jgi:hypothetical protein
VCVCVCVWVWVWVWVRVRGGVGETAASIRIVHPTMTRESLNLESSTLPNLKIAQRDSQGPPSHRQRGRGAQRGRDAPGRAHRPGAPR